MKSKKIKIFIILIAALILTIIALFLINQTYQITVVSIPKFTHETADINKTESATSSSPGRPYDYNQPPPAGLNLPVAFISQAPTGNWDKLHSEACEEAVAFMAGDYFDYPEGSLPKPGSLIKPGDFETELAILTKWQDDHFGYHLDTTSAETAQMMAGEYALRTKLIENFTADDIKKELARGYLVIISENGRLLGNPNYKRPGPIHHMLLIRGYNSAGFITNDSGTKNGLNYFYDFATLYNAAADWNHSANNVDMNKKIAIVVWK